MLRFFMVWAASMEGAHEVSIDSILFRNIQVSFISKQEKCLLPESIPAVTHSSFGKAKEQYWFGGTEEHAAA